MKYIKVLIVLGFFLTLTLYSEEKTDILIEKSKDWNLSMNLKYYGYISIGSLVIFNYKYFQCFASYSRTIFNDNFLIGGHNTFETGLGGQYDLIKSEKMDSLFFANIFFTAINGKMDGLTHDGLSDVILLNIGHSIGYEFSVGSRIAKFNAGIAVDVQFSVYSKTEDMENGVEINDKLGFFSWLNGPGLKIYTGIKF